MAAIEHIIGMVSRVNGTGFEIAERPGTRFTISQFARPKPALPAAGQRVAIGLDSRGFVQSIDIQDGEGPAGDVNTAGRVNTSTDGDTTSTRLACLKAAVRFLADRPDAKHGDVLQVAERFEAWVGRKTGEAA
jgi:hypothetical protein